MMNKKFYLTTTLPYVNAELHIGHALEFTQADAIIRYFRQKLGSDNAFLNIGTDEHGLKIYTKAEELGIPVESYVAGIANRFKDFCKLFLISYDNFYQTSQDYHTLPVQEFWKRCLANGDIYKGKYEGYYCVGCESYKTEKDLVDGKCPEHDKKPIWLSEENYFFKLSKYAPVLLDFFEKNPDFVKPGTKLHEAKEFVKKGLTDISISRKKENLHWGIEVPGDPDQIVYVWFDALTNYAAAVGFGTDEEKFNAWWPVTQLCGPDNLRFQSIIWQAMLASAGLPFSKQILVHGWILGPDGRKMSKTIGNVVSPFEQTEKYGAEVVRYYLLAGLPTYTDGSYKEDDLIHLYNANLADNYGNLLNRVIVLANRNNITLDKDAVEKTFADDVDSKVAEITASFEQYELYTAATHIAALADFGNKYIDTNKPWDKNIDDQKRQQILHNLSYLLDALNTVYEPLIPASAQKAKTSLAKQEPIILFQKIEAV